jgi:outer membrane protein OmpA-like peptidoglycan-associated protein
MQKNTTKLVVLFITCLFAMSFMVGCSHLEGRPNDKTIWWYIHKPLPEASRKLAEARAAGKDKECPAEFKAASDMVDKAYDVYNACHTQEAISIAQNAINKVNALCPPKPRAEVKPEPVIVVLSEPQAEEKIVAVASEPTEKVVVLAFEDIHFDFDKSTLKPEAQMILKRNIQLLKKNPKVKVRIAGYASASGTEEYNRRLSERRAKAVEDYLINEGVVSSERLSIIGYGETRPAEYEATPKDLYSKAAKANMRVLFEIIVK